MIPSAQQFKLAWDVVDSDQELRLQNDGVPLVQERCELLRRETSAD